jgi:hypothetical protein
MTLLITLSTSCHVMGGG